jgi:AraC-like DNA-binding protein
MGRMKSMKQSQSSEAQPLDRLGPLFERFRVRAALFHAGPLCGVAHFAAEPGRAFLHVLRAGSLALTHPAGQGLPRRLRIEEPTLILYPRPQAHDFHHAPAEGSDFVCATLGFEGGDAHPLVRALPPLLLLPLRQLPGAQHTLALLFDETAQPRCGARLLADRLFEVLLLQVLRALLQDPAAHGLAPGLLIGLAEPRLAPLLIALHERPGEAWTLERMAERCGQSRSSFALAFKTALGEAPLAYLTRWRLLLAQQGLSQGRPMKQLAEELGYASAASLARAFGAQYGQRPRAFQQLSAAAT